MPKKRIVLLATNDGYQDHPDYYQNLAANPDVEVTIDGRTIRMRAQEPARSGVEPPTIGTEEE